MAYGYQGTSGPIGQGSSRGSQGGSSQYGQSFGQYQGAGPKGYQRSNERLKEDICERLTDDDQIDARNISIEVKEGVVTLDGSVSQRWMKHRAEDVIDACSGVKEIRNNLTVTQQQQQSGSEQSRSDQQGEEHKTGSSKRH